MLRNILYNILRHLDENKQVTISYLVQKRLDKTFELYVKDLMRFSDSITLQDGIKVIQEVNK
jgi:hypothetical protein